ncbi:MAG: TatD family hydrolase [Candidatus Pacebacteria bacterium]|nr:TatD family hydrolase [Candidatus Paceibacterota bacterium]
MIDVHCHLEQEDYQKDRGKVVEGCKKELRAVIDSCCHTQDFDIGLELAEKYKNFFFLCVGIHPTYIEEISDKETKKAFDWIEKHKDKIVGIGETGLDFKVAKEEPQKEKQKNLFLKFIDLARSLDKPLVVHSRKAFFDSVEILEKTGAKKVLMHFFTEPKLVPKILENGWFVSVNTTLLTSKDIKKIVKELPLERIMTETDSPWLGENGKRNDPRRVKPVIEEIARLKNLSFEEVDEITTQNAIKFFNLLIGS